MGFPKTYFERNENDPQPLVAKVSRRVRFEEVDMLHIVWHGHYVSFLDDGREAFGDRYGLSYSALKEAQVAAPIVQLKLDYHAPLKYGETMEIETIAHWTDSLRLNFEYRITGPEERLVLRGSTVQLFMEPTGTMLLTEPEIIRDFRQSWKNGEFA